MAVQLTGEGVDSLAHIIQTALTPVFLLSGIGTLLNVFNTRLARVTDHAEHASELLEATDDGQSAQLRVHLARLQRRIFALDSSIALSAVGGAATCMAVFVLFLGGVRDTAVATGLIVLFGGALVCIVGALIAFLVDSVLAWHGLRVDGPLPRPKPAAPG
ncbi:MAG: DUF2721 domain-containing protein [Janthinobacterium lividum]